MIGQQQILVARLGHPALGGFDCLPSIGSYADRDGPFS
jgi:hypothetical protein